jgi:hypothetical protein
MYRVVSLVDAARSHAGGDTGEKGVSDMENMMMPAVETDLVVLEERVEQGIF